MKLINTATKKKEKKSDKPTVVAKEAEKLPSALIVPDQIKEWQTRHQKKCGTSWTTSSWMGLGWGGDKNYFLLICNGCGSTISQLTPTSEVKEIPGPTNHIKRLFQPRDGVL